MLACELTCLLPCELVCLYARSLALVVEDICYLPATGYISLSGNRMIERKRSSFIKPSILDRASKELRFCRIDEKWNSEPAYIIF